MTEEVKPFTAKQEKFGRFFIKNIGSWQVHVYDCLLYTSDAADE